jgi:hypothetical protein
MRTTLDIDDDVLAAAKELASGRKTTAGKVISDLARKALLGPPIEEKPEYRNGFRLMPRTGVIITPEMVEQWLEDDI